MTGLLLALIALTLLAAVLLLLGLCRAASDGHIMPVDVSEPNEDSL